MAGVRDALSMALSHTPRQNTLLAVLLRLVVVEDDARAARVLRATSCVEW